ncbi:TPA: cobalt ECF transporter T component CbiQ [Candidatus Bathyarchaeota archaeon]|nr:cobalt ECF transporter T component CbiQ [Candidatus Bathyarchaeota archaeon]
MNRSISDFLKAFREASILERYNSASGLLQKIDPRAKLAVFLALILASVASNSSRSLALFLLALFLLASLSRIPLKTFLFRSLFFITVFSAVIALPIPFITPGSPLVSFKILNVPLQITGRGVSLAALFILRVWVCASSAILLTLTTRFSALIKAMESFRFPKVFTMMASITYRFIFLFIDEAYRMALAREARIGKKASKIEAVKSVGLIVSTLLIRAYERGERVYLAMKNRGYRGATASLNDLKFNFNDMLFGSIFLSFIALVLVNGGL